MPVTASLVQSGILLATYELAIKRPELAYITVRTAGNMHQILRSTTTLAMSQSTEAQELEKAEMYNTSRGLVIMHILITLEATQQLQIDLASSPHWNEIDLPPSHAQNQLDPVLLTATNFEPSVQAAMKAFRGDGFHRFLQASMCLQQVMRYMSLEGAISETIRSLDLLDEKIQSFLKDVMQETLFMLHKGILKLMQRETAPESVLLQQAIKSGRTYQTAVRMIANVARNHMDLVENIAIIPITAFYSMQEALDHLQNLNVPSSNTEREDIQSLLAMTQAFDNRWGVPRSMTADGIL
ncbi:uncharacterized protein AB675_647 [Cyphellophora attinorum]|uniref:Uncharacterized protein n=1 Tax=Cyphellophora attinorum TaxID=1664694 RepID=A0A0N0NS27_9EURO|nr:uncharacterized protein AB675_647 [Phialophora attinorum]KPI45771.1 hypothetical protein AB675_647 [Phialophora attinorum]